MTNVVQGELDGYDLFSSEYVRDERNFWSELRSQECPVAHSAQWGGSWLVVGYEDIQRILNDQETFSSRAVELGGEVPPVGGGLFMPPITLDPPLHQPQRDVLAPYFTPAAALAMESPLRERAATLAQALVAQGGGDLMAGFARPLTLFALTRLLDVPTAMQPQFEKWSGDVMHLGPTNQALRTEAIQAIFTMLDGLIAERTANPGTDLVSYVAAARVDGELLSRKHRLGMLILFVLAGADTTWSALGSSLWHLAAHPDDARRILEDPTLLRTTAVEEFLRAYAPVTVARITTQPTELHGRCPVAHERVVMPMAAANRDPAVFEQPDEVKLDRRRNRHMTFGVGPHRCIGMHLARVEIRVGISEWLKVAPQFRLDPAHPVEWVTGHVRGPASVHVKLS